MPPGPVITARLTSLLAIYFFLGAALVLEAAFLSWLTTLRTTRAFFT